MKMLNPKRKTSERGIKMISCRWSHADYFTHLYKTKNGVGRICDCAGFWFKRRCKHISALEQWARDSVKNKEDNKKPADLQRKED